MSLSDVTGLFHGYYISGREVLQTYSGVSAVMQGRYIGVTWVSQGCYRAIFLYNTIFLYLSSSFTILLLHNFL